MTRIPRRGTRARGVALLVPLAVLMLAGCDALTKSDQLPPNVTDPAVTQTHEGALQAYRGTVAQFRRAFGGAAGQASGFAGDFSAAFVAITGLLSDELQSGAAAAGESN